MGKKCPKCGKIMKYKPHKMITGGVWICECGYATISDNKEDYDDKPSRYS